MKLVATLYVILVALQFFDIALTYMIIESGKGSEANPIMEKILKKYGAFQGLVMAKVFAFICLPALLFELYLIMKVSINSDFVSMILGALDVLYIGVAVNNFKVYTKK